MESAYFAYKDRFGDLDTWGLPLTSDELETRMQKALDEGVPIDLEAEYGWRGTKDLPEGAVA